MSKLFTSIFILFLCAISNSAFALLNLELTKGMAGAVPIAVVPFSVEGQPSQDVSGVVSKDLQISGRFKVYGKDNLPSLPSDLSQVHFDQFNKMGVDNIVIGKIQQVDGNRYQVTFKLLDAFKGQDPQHAVLLTRTFTVSDSSLRALSHHISDLIYQQITGTKGVFSTKIAYIVVQNPGTPSAHYALEVADMDGYGPRTMLASTDPIMSPSWSSDARRIAYVSFEKQHAAIYIQDVATAARHLVSEFEGINGAPAWSPDSKKLAVVLSKSGSPNIYTLDLATHHLTQITKDGSINTEPAWSPDGKSIIFTSTRSGGPQIYQKNLASGQVSRLTYDGNYNARASYTSDGNHIVVLNKQEDTYNIGILDLNSGNFHVITNSGSDCESPSIAPNGSMVLYGTIFKGRTVLGLAATDNSVQLRMPPRDGEVQDPSWSPFLS